MKLTDFGIAKAADAVPVTRTGMVMGTAHYIAPEQASGAEAGPAGDVYSLGIVGYECLVGHRPFRAESAVAVAMMQVRDQPPPLPGSVPAPTRELIAATLVKDPTQRYATGGEFAEAVAAVRRGEPVPVPASISGNIPVLAPPRPARRSGSAHGPRPATPPRAVTGTTTGPQPGVTTGPGPAVAAGSGSGPAAGAGHPPSGVDGAGRADAERPVDPAPAPPDLPPLTPSAPIVPLQLQPVTRSGRTLLVVLFVLLTLAALVLGVFVLRGGVNLGELTLGGIVTGSVAGWADLMAGSVVLVRSGLPRTAKEAAR